MTKILFAVKARKRSFGVLMTLVLLASSLTILVQFREAKAASIVWTGATNNNWSTGSNWVGGVAPGLSDIAVFNSTYNVAATVDASISVAGISVTAGYTQTITQAAVMTIGASGFIQADGTFTGATQTIDINGPLTISAGIFTATSGETQVQGNMTVSAGVTFNHNSGQFEFNGSTDTTLDVDTTLTMNNFETNKSSATVGIAIASGDTIVLAGTLYLTNGELNGPSGKIQTPGTVTRTGGDGGDGIINMTGAAAQTLTLGTAVAMPGVTIDNPNVAISLTGGFEGVVTLNAGTITGVTSIRFSESLIIDGGTFVAPAITYFNKDWTYTSGTFTHSDGTVYIDDDGTANDHVISGTPTFYNLKIFQSNKLANVQFAAGSTTTILNEATFGMSYFTGMDEDSRISLSSDSAGSAASIDFQGRVNMFHVDIQDITNTGSSFYCYVRCEDSGGNTGIDFSPMSVVYVSEISGETTEAGGTATFTVVLAGRPSSNVTIPLISSDTGEGTASSASLTFTNANWSTPQTVTVTGQDDLVDDGTISYTIQLAITASSDSRFSGLNPDDVTVKNQDDDIGDDSVQFDYLANFDDEEVAGTTGTNVGAFWSGGNGLGWIYDNDTAWTEIDVLASKIKPGCLMTVEGEQYIISQLVDEGDYGYDVILSKNNPNSEAIGATLDALADNDVESITCLESEGGGIKLNDGFLNTEAINMQFSYDMLYDSVNDQIVAGIYNTTNLQLVDVTAVTSSNVTIGSDPRGVAYDSLRDVLWVTNYDDDTVTAVNASDGSYAFTTLGASTFSVGNAPWRIAYDNVNDKLWVTHAIGNDLLQVDPSDGSTTATLAMGDEMTDVVYDSTNDSVWVLSVANVLIEIDGSTAAYKAGTLAASSYDVSVQGTNLDNLVYDSTLDVLWITDNAQANNSFISKVRASDGVSIGGFVIGEYSNDVQVKSAANEIWVSSYNDYAMSVVDAVNGRLKALYAVGDYPASFSFDSNGDLWVQNYLPEKLAHFVENAVPTGYYYTISTNATSDIDVSADGSIDAVDVTETLNSQNIYYSVSFDDGDSYKVWGSWRTVASNKIADHGGVDGNWYYRNNASTWTAAVPNTKNAAISAAVAAGSNNQMDSTTLEGLANTDWALAGGFDAGTTSTLNLAATLYSTDATQSPLAQSVDFTFGTGISSSAVSSSGTTPTEIAIEINGGANCTSQDTVEVVLTAKNAEQVIVGNLESFIGEDWREFVDDDGDLKMTVNWVLEEGDGEKTVYAQFRSVTKDLTIVISDSIEMDTTDLCSNIPVDEGDQETDQPAATDQRNGCMGITLNPLSAFETANYRFGVSPTSGAYSTADMVIPGEVIRSKSSSTVYCIAPDLTRRAFIDELIYFTHVRSFEDVRWVEDEALYRFPLKEPVLPNIGVSLLKFTDSNRVYDFTLNEDKTRGTVYWILNESIAASSFGENWADYVIDLNPGLYNRFDIGSDILEAIIGDTSRFRRRVLLNEASSKIENQVR